MQNVLLFEWMFNNRCSVRLLDEVIENEAVK